MQALAAIPAIPLSRGFLTAVEFGKLPSYGYINPKSVRFSQNSISESFKEGGSFEELTAGLKSGAINPENIPPIRLVLKEGGVYTLDNRRLKAFQDAGIPIKYQRLESIPKREGFKFTTTNEGESIQVRSKGKD